MEDELSNQKLVQIISNLAKMDSELEHVEFKVNQADPEMIAKNISAITNSMTRRNFPRGYMIWGIDNASHEFVGTSFRPFSAKVKNRNKDRESNEELLVWLSKYIKPSPKLDVRELEIDEKKIVIFIITSNPLELSKFRGNAFIRIGANTRPLNEFPSIEKEVWSKILSREFETISAKSNLSKDEVISLLDFDSFYTMRQNRVHVERGLLFTEAIKCGMIRDNQDTTYDITNLGALLYAKKLDDFSQLSSKTMRVILYRGNSKLNLINEERSVGGYIVEFNHMHNYIMNKVISEDTIDEDGIRREKYLYPTLTIRELLANTIIHQDLSTNVMHPMVEIYSDRIEFINPGAPLVPEDRFLDYPPQTRNQRMAEEFYRVGLCEIQGSGWDKVAIEASELSFPAPKPEVTQDTTRIVLMQEKTLANMTNEERMWSLYTFACLLWVKKQFLTNTLVRQLFHIPDNNLSMASTLLSQAVKYGLIIVFDEQAGTRSRKYMPKYVNDAF